MNNSFKEIYDRIYNQNEIQNIEKAYRKRSSNILKFFGLAMLVSFIFPPSLLLIIPIFAVYMIMSSSKEKMAAEEEYLELYKLKFILPLFREVFQDVQYRPKEPLSFNRYLEAEYKDKFINVDEIKTYSSNDHIVLPVEIRGEGIGYLDIYDVKLEKKTSGKSRKLTIFDGLTASITLPKSINTKIKLTPKVISNIIDNSKVDNLISTNNPEFDNYFALTAEQGELASRIYTADVIQRLMEIFNTNKKIFSINIINDILYVRVTCFSPLDLVVVFGNEKHVHMEKTIISIETIKEVTCLIYEVINNLEK